MANYTISLVHRARDGLVHGKTIAFHGTLDEAKRRGEALRMEDYRERGAGGVVSLTGPRGGRHVLVRHAYDTGPYAWVWHRGDHAAWARG